MQFVNKDYCRSTLIYDFWREVYIMRQLNHENVVQLLDLLETEQDYVLVLEYCGGGDLYQRIAEGGLMPETEARTVMRQLCNAVQHLHQRGVAHRDVKPENVLFDEYGAAKLSDFGLSAIARPGTMLRTCCGSLEYAAPEVLLDRPEGYCGSQADIYSLGVTLYAMLSCDLPYQAGDSEAMTREQRAENFSMPSYISPACADLLRSMLRFDPNARPNIAAVLQHPWFSVQSSETPAQMRSPPSGQPGGTDATDGSDPTGDKSPDAGRPATMPAAAAQADTAPPPSGTGSNAGCMSEPPSGRLQRTPLRLTHTISLPLCPSQRNAPWSPKIENEDGALILDCLSAWLDDVAATDGEGLTCRLQPSPSALLREKSC